jgi:hypothetical protein
MSETPILGRDEFNRLMLQLFDEAAVLPPDRPWSLSAPEKFKVAIFLESITGEHYDPLLLQSGIRSLDDCFEVYETKRGHPDSVPLADANIWRPFLEDELDLP